MYTNKINLARMFGVSPPTVYRRVEGIKKEIGGRYNRYAIVGNLISAEVYADYEKYHKRLGNKNLRKTIPPFDMEEAGAYLSEVKRRTSSERDTLAG